MRRPGGILLLGLCLGIPSVTTAIGWGKPVARSMLGEPLRIEIPLKVSNQQLRELEVNVASPATLARLGISASPLVDQLEYGIMNQSHAPTLEIHSRHPVREPFVQLVLELTTPEATLVRPVTVLVNPPGYGSAKRNSKTQTAPRRERKQQDPTRTSSLRRYGPVRSGEKLWSIAGRVKPEAGITITRMISELFQANPQAFRNNDRNLLKTGVYLTVPETLLVTAATHRASGSRPRTQHQSTDVQETHGAASRSVEDSTNLSSLGFNTVSITPLSNGAANPRPEDADPYPAITTPMRPIRPASAANKANLHPHLAPATVTGSAMQAWHQRIAKLNARIATLSKQISQRQEKITTLQTQLKRLARQSRDKTLQSAMRSWPTLVLLSSAGTLLLLLGLWLGKRFDLTATYVEPEWTPERISQLVNTQPATSSRSPTTGLSATSEDRENETDPLGDNMDLPLPTGPGMSGEFIDLSETDAIDELETYIAKGEYTQAKTLLSRLINLFPDETIFRFYLLKILHAGREIESFHEHASELGERREQLENSQWEEVMDMGAALLPDEPLYCATDSATTKSSGEGCVIQFSRAKSTCQSDYLLDLALEDVGLQAHKTHMIEFLSQLKKNEQAP